MNSKNKWTADDIPDQKGRIAIVTGSSSGIGLETARVLALKNATVVIAVRNLEKGKAAAGTIISEKNTADLSIMQLDLADLESIRRFVEEFRASFNRFDLLVNNAGVMAPPFAKTRDGFELQFGTNHLGHFSLTGLLFDLLKKTPESRVINVSSSAHNFGNIDFNDLTWENRTYKPLRAYGDSKIANLHFTYELARKSNEDGKNPIITAAHPGWTATELQRHSGFFNFFNRFFAQDIPIGALPTLYGAVGQDVKNGDYFGPSGFMESRGYPKKVKSNELSRDASIAAKLWNVSEELTGVKF